jgi:hypothetical protein
MRKPVSLLGLDETSASLAHAVQQRVAAACGLDDLVQSRAVDGADAESAILSIHAQRQRPDSPLRARDDISTRELVLLLLSAAGPARLTALETASRLRQLFEMRRLAPYFTIELLCLMPEVTASADYAAAYALLKALSAAEPRPFDEAWLLDATNGSRVKFGAIEHALPAYADAIAGSLTLEPEMSGALPALHPRGMPPVFSSFGCAELVFPRELALQHIESRFSKELVHGVILSPAEGEGPSPSLKAKQLVVTFPQPENHSLFQRFQPKTFVTEQTRSADELIATTRAELKSHRETAHLHHLETLARQGEQTTSELAALVTRTADDTLDREGYDSAIRLLDALLDPLPELRPDADLAPRNLVTELTAATAALDQRLGFSPNTAASDAARKHVRELTTLIQDQKLVADAVSAANAADRLDEMEREKQSLLAKLPDVLFAEERENSANRSAARDAEGQRLAGETLAREEELRQLFAHLPRAEQNLREALEERRAWLWRQLLWTAAAVAALYAVPFVFGVLRPNLERITWIALTGLGVYAVIFVVRYVTMILPRVREARELLERIRSQIEATDKAKNAAHNEELRYEFDITLRRTTLGVLARTRQLAADLVDGLRTRRADLESMVASFPQPSITAPTSILDDADLDAWYERTSEERRPFVREFPIRRSESRQLALDELRTRITSYACTAFESFRKLTIGGAASLVAEGSLAQRLKRFTETSAPLIELRDDDLPAQQAMQRDTTLWLDPSVASFASQVQRRFPDAVTRPATDPLRVQALTRVLHYPGYLLGQIEYYRAQYAACSSPEHADLPDLLPLPAPVREAYEQVLLARAVGVIERQNGHLVSANTILGDTNLAAAQRLAASESAALRRTLDAALTPRLSIAPDVERDLRQLLEEPLSALERGILTTLVKRYAEI